MVRDPDGPAAAPLRIGLFGGTFDPPHNGHVAVAADVASALALDRVLWIAAGEPPHKPTLPLTPAPIRLDMVRAATEHDVRFVVSAVEILREGPSFTVDTLREIRSTHVGAELFLIIGADQFSQFASWRDPEVILQMATVVVMDRAGVDASAAVPNVKGVDSARFVQVRRVDLSSTELRARVAAGEDVSADVPLGVARLITSEGLYRR